LIFPRKSREAGFARLSRFKSFPATCMPETRFGYQRERW
jgi:hypothetical protein